MSERETLEPVELHSSYVWNCNECGVENWQRSVTTFLDKNNPEDAAAIALLYGDDVLEDGHARVQASTYPNTVTCHECKTKFLAVAPEDDVPDVDDGED